MPASRKLLTTTLLGLAAAAVALTVAHAEPRFGHERMGFKGEPPILAADTNGDGAIDASEWNALFAKLDANGNGKIEASEMPFHRGAWPPPEALAYFFARDADTDGDGKITREEWDARVAALDTDKDGALSPSELSFRHRSESGDTLPPFAAHWDTNSDGKLEASELDALFTAADRDGDGVLTRMQERGRR